MRASFIGLWSGLLLVAGMVACRSSLSPVGSAPVAGREAAGAARMDDGMRSGGSAVPPKRPASALPRSSDWDLRFVAVFDQPEALQPSLLEDLAAEVPKEELRDALDLLGQDRSAPAVRFVGLLLERWAQSAPAEAADWAAAHLPDLAPSHAILGNILRGWAERDLPAAGVWAKKLPAGEGRRAALMALAKVAARTDPPAAIALAAGLPPGPEVDSLLNHSAQQWAMRDFASAVAWINRVPNPALREKILGEVAVNIGVSAPSAAAEFCLAVMQEGAARDYAVANVVRFWAVSAPAGTAAWIEKLPEGVLRDLATENLLDVWKKDDPARAGQWAERHRQTAFEPRPST